MNVLQVLSLSNIDFFPAILQEKLTLSRETNFPLLELLSSLLFSGFFSEKQKNNIIRISEKKSHCSYTRLCKHKFKNIYSNKLVYNSSNDRKLIFYKES